jgi:hypothetical protein
MHILSTEPKVRLRKEINEDNYGYILGSFFSKEKLLIEHKEFSLKQNEKSLQAIKEFIEKYCIDEKMMTMINENISFFLEKYLARYVTAFSNTNKNIECQIDEKNGILNIGIDNDGYITGIPYYDLNDNLSYFQKLIQFHFKNLYNKTNIIFLNKENNESVLTCNCENHEIIDVYFGDTKKQCICCKSLLKEKLEGIKFDLIELKHDSEQLQEVFLQQYKKYLQCNESYANEMRRYNVEYNEYLRLYSIFSSNMKKYYRKLAVLYYDDSVMLEYVLFMLDKNEQSYGRYFIDKLLNIKNIDKNGDLYENIKIIQYWMLFIDSVYQEDRAILEFPRGKRPDYIPIVDFSIHNANEWMDEYDCKSFNPVYIEVIPPGAFKESIIEFLKTKKRNNKKPIKPDKPLDGRYASALRLTPIALPIINNNNIKYYLLQITVPVLDNNNIAIVYNDGDKWLYCLRRCKIDVDDPECFSE